MIFMKLNGKVAHCFNVLAFNSKRVQLASIQFNK